MSLKAFELVPTIDRLQLMGEKAQTKIECIECCGKTLYIGTNDSFILQYSVEEKIHVNGKIIFNSQMMAHRYLGMKKPVTYIKGASALNRLLVVCDSCLVLMNMMDLEVTEGGLRLKGISSLCVNENPHTSNPFSVQVCVAKKKQLQIYNITDERIIHISDISTIEPPVALAMDGNFICAALATQYVVYNYETGYIQKLFPYEIEETPPLIKRISKEEFLLSGPSALGMFVTAAGISERPPVHWSDQPITFTYLHPYILALSREFILVYSILDQQQKQSLPFAGGKYLGNFDGKMFVCSGTAVYSLTAIPWEKQVQALLDAGRVEEALSLAQNANHAGLSKEQYQKIYQHIQQQGGFIEFEKCNFDRAKALFRSGKVDVREVISLFPQMMPTSSNFVHAVPALHHIADINQVSQGDQVKIQQAKVFLMEFLEEVRDTGDGLKHRMDVDTALLKLYAESNSAELEAFVSASEICCDMKDCVEWLEQYRHYHTLALLYHQHQEHEMSLQLWAKMIKGELVDERFQGFDFFVESLANISDHDLVWKYASFVMEWDQAIGIRIFTDRPPSEHPTEKMNPESIMNFLDRYPVAMRKYLQYIIFVKKLQKEKYHTHLAVLYLDSVLKLKKQGESDELKHERHELQHLLQVSSLYRVQLMLGKVLDTDLFEETALLYGKLEEHEKALDILVHKLQDYTAAEQYCIRNSQGKDPKYKHKLFHSLLSIYLDPQLKPERREELIVPALDLLNNRSTDFDTVQVLELLPTHWSVSVVNSFLCGAVRGLMHQRRICDIESKLARGENVQKKFALYDIQKDMEVIVENKYCCVCKKPFRETSVTRYPNGVLTHVACAQHKNICPLTGEVFKIYQVTGKEDRR